MKKNPNNPRTPLLEKGGVQSVISSLIAIFLGLVFGAVILLVTGLLSSNISFRGLWEGFRLVFLGIFCTGRDSVGNLVFGFNPTQFGNMLFRATPILMTGLSVAVAQKTGLFNIGASGQYLMGTAATLYLALAIPSSVVPAWLIWILAFLGGMLAGALWGAIPGLFKAKFNINEVITCIMTNWIAAALVTWFFDEAVPFLKNSEEYGKAGLIKKTVANGVVTPKFGLDKIFPGSQVNGGILIAVVLAVLMYILLFKTTFGFRLRCCGSNRHAAKYAGINDNASIVISMALAGALAAAGASLYWLSGNTEFTWTTYQTVPAEGFNGIPVALLASSNPIACVFTACFMSMLNVNGLQLKSLTPFNEYITDIIIASIVYLSAFALLIKLILGKLRKNREAKAEAQPKSEEVEEIETEVSFAEPSVPAGTDATENAEEPAVRQPDGEDGKGVD